MTPPYSIAKICRRSEKILPRFQCLQAIWAEASQKFAMIAGVDHPPL
jgi:hypothetical protein